MRLAVSARQAIPLDELLKHFARETPNWRFAGVWSKRYQAMNKGPAAVVVAQPAAGFPCAGIAFANSDPNRPNSFHLTNIVPKDVSHLTMDEYNRIGLAFARAFRSFLRKRNIKATLSVRGPDIGLREIIPASKCRRLFETYLKKPEPVSHPSDIQALDVFICSLARFGAAVQTDYLARWLREDHGWSAERVDWVQNRIDIGMEILRTDRRF